MAWKKGQSGNPGGKPQRKDWAEALRIVGNEKAEDGKRKLRKLAETVYNAAMSGDMDAVREIALRRDGKPSGETNVNVTHGLSEGFLAAIRNANDQRQLRHATVIDCVPDVCRPDSPGTKALIHIDNADRPADK